MNYIFIDSKDGVNKVGIVEDNRLVEYHTEEISKEKLVGNVYRGRVLNVLQGMEAAFVDIGEGKNAYLYVKDALDKEQLYAKEKFRIDQLVKNGEEIIVQVTKEALGTKGPKVTTHISLPGRYLVLTPYSRKISVSKKIVDSKEINRLKEIGRKIICNEMGVIFRTISEGIDESLLIEEYNTLLEIYSKIERERNFLPCPKLLYRELDLVYAVVRDSFNEKSNKVIVNNKDIYKNLLLLEDYFSFKLEDKIVLDTNFSISENRDIQMDIKEALERKVSLESGGYIVIDETEALTAIDVNTGKYIGSYSLEDTVFRTNLEAAKEIARQVRLRDIGGIIIVDFIDMKNKKDVSLVLSQMSQYLRLDRNKPNIVGITKLGLVEMTRKKIRPTLDSQMSVKCTLCHGIGRIKK